MTFESGVAPKDWSSVGIVLLHNGKVERTECRAYTVEVLAY